MEPVQEREIKQAHTALQRLIKMAQGLLGICICHLISSIAC